MVDQEQLEKALIEELSIISDTPISRDTDLPGEAELDSFGTMQIIAFLEDTYGIEILDDRLAIENFASAKVIASWALPMIEALGQ